MKKLFLLLLTIISLGVAAQSPLLPEKRIQYFFSFSSGVMLGEPRGKSATFSSSTVHGIKVGSRLRAGLGIGYDSYLSYQTLPLFGQLSYDVLRKKNAIFLQMNYGWSHAWMPARDSYWPIAQVEGGRMFNPMIGYRICTGNMSVTIAAGYKFQRVQSESSNPYVYYDLVPNTPGYTQTIEQGLERMVISIGIGWR